MAKRKTQEQFEREVNNVGNGEYVLKSKYLGSNKKVTLFHTKCNMDWEVEANSFLRGTRCASCFGNKKRTHEQFLNEVKNLHGDEIVVLSKYINATEQVKIKHALCGNTYELQANSVLNGSKCPFCSGNKLTHTEFLERINKKYENEFTPLEKYINCDTKLLIKHSKCEHEWKVVPTSLLHTDYRCPNCNKISRGEEVVRKTLNRHKIRYSYQFTISDCINENLLKFDFCLFNKNHSIELIVEYDGQQHFEPVNHFGGLENLESVQYNDSIKNNYCKNNNIELLRIPYWEFDNISDIVENKLIEHKLINY